MQGIFERVAGVPMGDLFDAWIRSPADVDAGATLQRVGLSVERAPRAEGAPCSLGVRIRSDGGHALAAAVTRESAAARAGIDPGDEIVGVGGLRVEGASVEATLRGRAPGDAVDVLVARDGKLLTRRVILDPPRPDRVKIVPKRDASDAARAACEAWLGRRPLAWSAGGTGT
jgi:predicted metalloprotease with PDZ domain